MKNKSIPQRDDWATPPYIYDELNKEFNFDLDPCPLGFGQTFGGGLEFADGLTIEWGNSNFVNPPYSLELKTAFVKKAIEEAKKGKTVVMLLPVSTSTVLFHDFIKPNAKEIRFVRGRIKFIGVNTKGKEVSNKTPMHDSMIVIF